MGDNIKAVTKFSLKLITSLYLLKIFASEYLKIFRKRSLYKEVQLTRNEEDQIESIWQNSYGKRIPTNWHRLYQSYNGKFNERYFPEIYFTTRLESKMNDWEIGRVISDQSFFPMYFRDIEGVRIPDTYFMNNSGIFYSANRKIITEDAAITMIKDIGKCIIKPTMPSRGSGSAVLCYFKKGIDQVSRRTAEDIIASYKENYLVQEKIISSDDLRELYPYSISIIKVITYLLEDRVEHAPVTLNMARVNRHDANGQTPGVSVGVTDTGGLYDRGFTHLQEVLTCHPDTGTVFSDIKLPVVKDVIRVAKEMHEKIPHMRIVSWDFTVDENEKVVLMAFNIYGQSVWVPQMATGKAVFGKDTEKMIEMMKN